MKTTKSDFNKFKKYCKKYISILGLTEWSIFYEHSELRDKYSYAETFWDVTNGVSRIILNTEWDNIRDKSDKELETLALHEVLHVLMCPLTSEATERYTTKSRVETTEHIIIRRLEKLV